MKSIFTSCFLIKRDYVRMTMSDININKQSKLYVNVLVRLILILYVCKYKYHDLARFLTTAFKRFILFEMYTLDIIRGAMLMCCFDNQHFKM